MFADDAFGYDPETMAEALTESVQEISQNTIARTELLSRGLRPSSRRFSGKGGRPALEISDIELDTVSVESEEEEAEVPVSEAEVLSEAEASLESAPAAETQEAPTGEGRRLRTRRRRRSASGQITVVTDEPTTDADGTELPEGESTVGPEVGALVAAADTFGDAQTPVSTEPAGSAFEPESEPPVGSVLPVEADVEAIAEVQEALDALAELAPPPAPAEPKTIEITVSSPEPEAQAIADSGTQPLADSAGVTVEAVAPPLPEGAADLPTADPMGQPAVHAALEEGTTPKPKRRRPSRAKKAAPVEGESASTSPVVADMAEPVGAVPTDPVSSEVPPAVESLDITTEALPVGGSEASMTMDADAALATESTESVDSLPDAGTAPVTEAAPAKPKRRRAPRAKKTDTPSA